MASTPDKAVFGMGSNVHVFSMSPALWPSGGAGSDYVKVEMSICASPIFALVRSQQRPGRQEWQDASDLGLNTKPSLAMSVSRVPGRIWIPGPWSDPDLDGRGAQDGPLISPHLFRASA